MMWLPLRCVTSLSEVGLLHSESEAGRRSVLSTFLLNRSHISVLHKRRCSEFIAQDSRSLLVLTWFYCDSPLFMSYVQHQHLSEWLLLQNGKASHRDPDSVACSELAERFLRVSSLCLCPVDPADRTPASCACCATPNAPAPSASRSVCAHGIGQNFRRCKQTKQA